MIRQLSRFFALTLCAAFVALGSAQADVLRQSVSTTSPMGQPLTDPSLYNNWSFTVGAGLGFAPRYSGSDRIKLGFVPVLNASYNQGFFFAGTQGIGMTPLRGDNYDLRFGVGFDGGRYEQDDSRNLHGLNKITYSFLGMVAGDYTFRGITGSANVQTALTGDYGTTFGLGIGSKYAFGEHLSLKGDVHVQLADDEHMRKFYGVSTKEAALSGKARYKSEGGIEKFGMTVALPYRIWQTLTLTPSVTLDQLAGDAADSPVVRQEFQPSGRLVATYQF